MSSLASGGAHQRVPHHQNHSANNNNNNYKQQHGSPSSSPITTDSSNHVDVDASSPDHDKKKTYGKRHCKRIFANAVSRHVKLVQSRLGGCSRVSLMLWVGGLMLVWMVLFGSNGSGQQRQYTRRRTRKMRRQPVQSTQLCHPSASSCPPRILSYIQNRPTSPATLQRLDTSKAFYKNPTGRTIFVSEEEAAAQKRINRSKTYRHAFRDPLHEGDCVPMRPWQEQLFPTCSLLHEVDKVDDQFGFLTSGGYNDVFHLQKTPYTKDLVLKQLSGPLSTDFTDRNFDRVRRDALLMERLTKSPYVMDMYAYCGFALLAPFGRHGNLEDYIWHPDPPIKPLIKLHLAAQVALGLAHAHDIDEDGISAMSHGDYAAKQYIFVDGVYKLNDFNRGRFIRWDKVKKEPCTYTIGNNDGAFRAPEEYKYDPETAKIDVWALGSIIFEILTGRGVWSTLEVEDAQKRIIEGDLPPFPNDATREDIAKVHPAHGVLLRAMLDWCWVYDVEDRPMAGEVAEFLVREAEKLGVKVHEKINFDA